MKTIIFLKSVTIFEIGLNIILAAGFNITMLTGNNYARDLIFASIGILHLSSMLLHWLAWKPLATTHTERYIFNVWVIGTFLSIMVISQVSVEITLCLLYLLLVFSFAWFFFYCYILVKEYRFLRKKKELYEQRELIHF